MSSMVLIGIAVVLLIVGLFFIMSGSSSEEEGVPISNPKEIASLKSAFSQSAESQDSSQSANKPKSSELIEESDKQIEEENLNLKKAISEQKEQTQQLEQELENLKKEYDQIKEKETQNIHALQDNIVKIQMEKDQLSVDAQIVEELKQKSELFDQQLKEYEIQQVEMKKFIEQLELDKTALLKAQSEEVDKTEFDALSKRLEGSIKTIEQLKGESKDLQETNQELRSNYEKTKEYNNHLLEKEKTLQFELTKNRAQNLGLEKLCEDFKKQIETLSSVGSDR